MKVLGTGGAKIAVGKNKISWLTYTGGSCIGPFIDDDDWRKHRYLLSFGWLANRGFKCWQNLLHFKIFGREFQFSKYDYLVLRHKFHGCVAREADG